MKHFCYFIVLFCYQSLLKYAVSNYILSCPQFFVTEVFYFSLLNSYQLNTSFPAFKQFFALQPTAPKKSTLSYPSTLYSTNIPFLCPSYTTFPPSKASRYHVQHSLAIYSAQPIQPSLHRKPVITMYNIPWPYTLPNLSNLPSIESQSLPCTTFLGHILCPTYTTFPPSKATPNRVQHSSATCFFCCCFLSLP